MTFMADDIKALLPLQPTTFHILLSLTDEDRHGYAIILAEDATSGLSAELHNFAVKNIFPRISRILKAVDIGLGQKA